MASALNDDAPGSVQIPDDGVALLSSVHPHPPWYKRLYNFLTPWRFRLRADGITTTVIEISRPEKLDP